MKYKIVGLCLLWMLSACSSSDEAWLPKAKQWEEFSVHFETRPENLRSGMNEFLILVDRQGKRHIPDLLVNIHINQDKIQQAMPDGALGVYRRALYVHDIHKDRLHVILSYHGKVGELDFPLEPDVQSTPAH